MNRLKATRVGTGHQSLMNTQVASSGCWPPLTAPVFVTTNGAAASSWRVGIANATSQTTNHVATDLALSSLHRLVVRYNATAGTASLWLDPANETSGI
jgi:hypothetical protein